MTIRKDTDYTWSSGGSSENSTEEDLVEAFESGTELPPVEVVTNGVGAIFAAARRVGHGFLAVALTQRKVCPIMDNEDLGTIPTRQGKLPGLRVRAKALRSPLDGSPVRGASSFSPSANRCGHDTEPIPRRYIVQVLTYAMRRCTSCGAHSRISIEPARMSIIRGV